MKTIKYNNKDYKLPFDVELPEDPTAEVEVKNRFSGQSTMLTPEEHKLYIEIKEHERDEDYNTMQKKLSKFSRLNASAFMVLLD